MNKSDLNTVQEHPSPGQFELRFQSLYHAGKALAFPCDARGDVLLDTLSAKALENYLFARAVVGHEYASPVVQPCCHA
ncbi:hypothetical protein [Paucibacter soli]|uniref:hypothetical protein n=1 Tax=Paucibacter soli TaxID=3133433 RepID=UPI003095C79B